MAIRISATTESDQELLTLIRDLAWKERKDVSEIIREAFKYKLYGPSKLWPENDRG